MPVISAGVVDKNGRVLIARQFMEINRARIEGLFHAFPRLRDTSVKKQATFLDAGSVRYVYRPMENQLFLVLITTTCSNVIDDLAILQKMSSVLSDTLSGSSICHEEIEAKSFRILFAFDEIVVGGKPECCAMDELQTYLEMDSVEETIYLEKKRQQEEAAKITTMEQSRTIKEKKMMGLSRSSYDPYGGFGSDGMGEEEGGSGGSLFVQDLFSSMGNASSSSNVPSFGGGLGSHSSNPIDGATSVGMALGKKGLEVGPSRGGPLGRGGMGGGGGDHGSTGSAGALSMKVQREIGSAPRLGARSPASTSLKGDSTASSGPVHVTLKIEEKMMVTQTRDGDVSSAEVKGELSLAIQDARCERILVELQLSQDGMFTFKPHPKLNKDLFGSRSLLAMSDPSKPFPLHQSITILQWKASQGVKITPPFIFTCWPELGRMTVEFELTSSFASCGVQHVDVWFPWKGQPVASVTPTVGTTELESSQGVIHWSFDITVAQSGSIEITLADGNVFCGDIFFPFSVAFVVPHSLAQVAVSRVLEVDTEMPIRFNQEIQLVAEKYLVE